MAGLFLIVYRVGLVVVVPVISSTCDWDNPDDWLPVDPGELQWPLDTNQDQARMRVLVDLHGGNPWDAKARQEYTETKEAVLDNCLAPDCSYLAMWTRYHGRVLLAMPAQAFSQLEDF
ncbi:hypothetical protein PGT21_002792 [Puccinia graminis f. sp. tritici]|uniref:Uncharacterized protein n=1 Tax=Puccinia graminis f. sp. tritici TaxID=56615 RepID=A0A5B0NX57_PUCGR|nr:hypothetical protein PGT21_002792 [Puccinia graminis f. sp. tritici]KAA1129972.1 hypothetical protein PGTUg99_003986 [Puccinia graminis f. sp. tritici]